ncbi:hypothetical protein [Desulfococcus sp.]|uniref:hypothetical protein n=1 Tax=Desulfococcus sp. TaxID=2025834 RepID=UPI003593FD48
MKDIRKTDNARDAFGSHENRSIPAVEGIMSGWQNYLADMLTRMDEYLRPGSLVTFERMQSEERRFFESLHTRVVVPDAAAAIFMPPSVIRQMKAAHPNATGGEAFRKFTDAGIVLASRKGGYRVILNAVFALAPFAPAIDIYEDGGLLAGYMYKSIDECIRDLTTVMGIYLGIRGQ